jgi:hypothetical protein
LQDLLNRVFHPEGIVYSQRGTQLILRPETFSETPMLLSGILIDSATSVPLMGAAIYFPELKQGVTTDATGHFQLQLLPGVWQVELSGNWVFTSGHAVTLPEGKYSFEGRQIPYSNPDQRNSRMPNYHRLDLALTLKQKKNRDRNWQGSWSFSLYNTYFRKNPVLIQFVEVVNNDPLLSAQQVTEVKSKALKGVKVFFTLIPAISYNFSF